MITYKTYEQRAKEMTTHALIHTVAEIAHLLRVYRNAPTHDAYVQKLHAEFDAYATEKNRRLAVK